MHCQSSGEFSYCLWLNKAFKWYRAWRRFLHYDMVSWGLFWDTILTYFRRIMRMPLVITVYTGQKLFYDLTSSADYYTPLSIIKTGVYLISRKVYSRYWQPCIFRHGKEQLFNIRILSEHSNKRQSILCGLCSVVKRCEKNLKTIRHKDFNAFNFK